MSTKCFRSKINVLRLPFVMKEHKEKGNTFEKFTISNCHLENVMPLKYYAFSVAIPMKVFLALSLQNLEVDHLLRCCFTLTGVEVT